MLMDLDKFKSVNDTYGHDAGDAVLKEFAQRLRENVRGIDLVARFGGEEFIAILPDTDTESAYSVGERLRKAVEATKFKLPGKGGELAVTVSIGISSTTTCNIDQNQLIKLADEALYVSKNEGRNRITFTEAA
jgi:two-component system cell cycle response regulator